MKMPLVKIIFSGLLFPVPLILEILLLGLILLWFTRRQRAGKLLVTVGTLLLACFSNNIITDNMLIPLEQKYPALIDPKAVEVKAQDKKAPVRKIVMLSGGYIFAPQMPVTDYLSESSLRRMVEAVRLYKELPGSKLILSWGKGEDRPSEAEVLAKVAPILGVNPQDLIFETESVNTEDQARRLKPAVGQERFILVTSASHMPRSMALFQKQGMHPLPAPAGYLVKKYEAVGGKFAFPSAVSLCQAERAVYEYLGLAWAWLRGKI